MLKITTIFYLLYNIYIYKLIFNLQKMMATRWPFLQLMLIVFPRVEAT